MKYSENLATSAVFSHSREVLESKMKQLKSLGKGNSPNKSQPLTPEEIDILYEKNLLGSGRYGLSFK